LSDSHPVAAYDYDLPKELIAQRPSVRRDDSRLMVLEGAAMQHRRFADLGQLLRPGDVLVLNETRVIAARLFGRRASGGRAELLLLHPADSMQYEPNASRWIAMARPARRLRRGDRVAFGELGQATIRVELEEGLREIELSLTVPLEEFLDRAGRMPLPPYIHDRSPRAEERYQTVFARVPGSVAAPTASLHFTPELLRDIERNGVDVVRLSLNVGLGTFRPVTGDTVEEHVMHAEAYAISPSVVESLQRARDDGRRIVAAGTTVVLALEGNVE
jgi:S-adenosylmethionine:tRNA ribosyltransferase-isomerase